LALKEPISLSLFGSVIAAAFQSVFHAKIHQNDVFFIFKKSFLRSAHQNDSKHKKKFWFFWKRGLTCVSKRS
jgi:hypothetical protein